jgi:hypothetical protein
MKVSSRKFALLMVALEAASPDKLFHCRPKLRLMQEPCEVLDANPSKYWNYRDEDFGGTVAALAKRRGGSHNVSAASSKGLLVKFLANHQIPRLTCD